MSNTYLITWNPSKWDFEGGFYSFLQQVENGNKPTIEWTVNSSSIKKDDEVYLMRLGEEPRGIIAKGVSLSDVHLALHYDPVRAMAGERTKHITVQFLSAVDFKDNKFLNWEYLKKQFPNQKWTPQGSGITIRDEYCDALKELWDQTINSINVPIYPKDIINLADGSVRYICERCGITFNKNVRCPECGQAVKEQYDF